MPVTVERVPDEPIIIAHLTGHIDINCVREMFEMSVPLMEQIEGRVWRITDAREVETTFADVVQILGKVSAMGVPGSTTDPRITSILVGSNAWVKMVSESLQQKQYGAMKVPMHATMDEGFADARAQIAEAAKAAS